MAVIHPVNAESEVHALALLRVYLRIFYRKLSGHARGRLHCIAPVKSLREISEIYESAKSGMGKEPAEGLTYPRMTGGALCQPQEREKLRQKWLSKLYLRDPERLVKSVKRRMLEKDAYWPGADLFLEAFEKMDDSVDAAALLDCFERKNAFSELKLFLENYYQAAVQRKIAFEEKPTARALSMMRERFSEDLTQSDVAGELGLSAAYFSTVFKRETGKSFVETLNEIRIEQAVKMLEAGERDLERIAADCGYTSKRYFLSVFQKLQNKTVTEYLEE